MLHTILIHAVLLDMQVVDQQVRGFGPAVEQDNVHGITWTTMVKVTVQQREVVVVLDTSIDAQLEILFVHVFA